MAEPGKLAFEAARLLAFGLDPRRSPMQDDDYRDLVDRHHADQDLREVLREMARGLGLTVLEVGRFGVMLGAEEDSVFAFGLQDYRRNLTVEQRLLHGLIQVAIAAYLYPNARELEDDVVKSVSVEGLDHYLRSLCETLHRRSPETSDPLEDAPEVEQAWQLYRRWPSVRESSRNRRTATTTQGLIAQAFEVLAQAGLFAKESDREGGCWRALRRYRVQVRELGAHEAYRLLTRVAQEEGLACPV